jgi:hypothetical protein
MPDGWWVVLSILLRSPISGAVRAYSPYTGTKSELKLGGMNPDTDKLFPDGPDDCGNFGDSGNFFSAGSA